MKGAHGMALGCALGAVEAKVVKWGRDVNERSWSPPQETLGVMPELFNAPPLPTPAPLIPKRALEKRAATDNTCAYVGGSLERSLYCDTTAYCASNSSNSHVGCCDDTRSSSCTVWTTCLAMSESAKYTTNNGLTLWCGFSDYPNCITHIYADSTSKASLLKGYTLLGCAVAAGSDKIYYNAFTSSKSSSSSSKISLTPNNPGTTTSPDTPNIPKNTQTPGNDPNAAGGGGVVAKVTTLYDTITSDGVVYTTATATATVPASGANEGSTSSSKSKSKSTPVGAIAGGVVGGVAALSLIALAAWRFMRRKKPEADVPSPPPPQPTIPVMAQQPPPPTNGYYGRESIAKPPFDSVSTPSQSPPPPQSPISPYQGSTPSPPPPGGHASMYGAAALGAAGGFAAGQYGQQGQGPYGPQQGQQYPSQGYQNQPPQQQQYQGQGLSPSPQQYQDQGPPPQQYQNQGPPQGYQNQSPPPPPQQYPNQPPATAFGYQQQQQGYPQQGQYPPPQQQQPHYTHGGYGPPQGQQGYASELPTQRGDGEVRELQG